MTKNKSYSKKFLMSNGFLNEYLSKQKYLNILKHFFAEKM